MKPLRIIPVLIFVVITLSWHNCSGAAVLKAPKKESTFSKLLSRMHRSRENARMDSSTSGRLWESTGRILKALLQMASSNALKRRSGRFFEEPKAEAPSPSFRSSRSSQSPRGRGRIIFPTDDNEKPGADFRAPSDPAPESRSPKWPAAAASNKQNKVSIITKSSPPKYYGSSGIDKMNNLLQFKNYENPLENTGILESTSMIRSQPLIVELGPGTTRDGRRLKTVEVQGVKIIVGEPKEDESQFFSWPN